MTFKIIKISTERRPDGNSEISAICLEDRQKYVITVANRDLTNKKLIKQMLETKCYISTSFDHIQENEII